MKKFKGCSGKVFNHFDATGDGFVPSTPSFPFLRLTLLVSSVKPSHPHVASLLNSQISVLLYVGTKDFICNWYGNNEWALQLEWDGAGEFREKELRSWYASADEEKGEEGKRAGVFRQAGGFAFATVEGAGHFVRPFSPLLSSNPVCGFSEASRPSQPATARSTLPPHPPANTRLLLHSLDA